MPAEEELVTLASLGNGAALELFDRELRRVVENIADPNTSARTKREITVKAIIEPEEDRTVGYCTLEVSSKLAGAKPVNTQMFFGRSPEGKLVAVTANITNPSLFNPDLNNITPLSAVNRQTQEGA